MITQTRTKLQTTSGGVEANLWPYCNDESTARYYNSSCGYDYAPYNMDQSALRNYWETADASDYYGTGTQETSSTWEGTPFYASDRLYSHLLGHLEDCNNGL